MVVLGVLLTLVVGMLDLGVAVFRQEQVSYAARAVARAASVHGSQAAVLGAWGPTTVGPVLANTTGSIPTETRSHLCSLNPASVTVTVEWPDGSNEPESRVRVTLKTSYQPTLTWLFGAKPMSLQAVSTMPISH
jgi:hypothetical protein